MKKIAVTGGSGGAGRYVVDDLENAGYGVLVLDLVAPESSNIEFRETDLTDYASVSAALDGQDAVVAFGANPDPDFDFATGADRFRNNTLCTYNVFNAAVEHGLQKVVWASSETVLGFPFENVLPDGVPITEDHPVKPQNSYALSKVVCEELARQVNQLYGLPIIALEYSNILHTGTDHPHNYDSVPDYWSDPASRKFNLWGYIDARDAATAARLALESDIKTAERYIIAAADTIMNMPNRELMAAVFPDVPITQGTGEYESLLSAARAREDFGFEPRYSWRDIVQAG